jgi:hypothetical protein
VYNLQLKFYKNEPIQQKCKQTKNNTSNNQESERQTEDTDAEKKELQTKTEQ